MRNGEAPALDVTTNTYSWNKDIFSRRIHQIAVELQGCRCDVIEFFKDSVASSDEYQTHISDARLRTTGLVPRKVYGRDEEKDLIIRMITAAESHIISVLPIVGIAGVGKTAVAQLVYNDPIVESQFERIWVCVSYNFDEVTLTREILEFLPQERTETSLKIPDRHEGAIGLGKLQEILKARMQYRRKRILLILDDVWHNLDDHRWKRLLLPLQSGHAKGNVILVTTRDLSVAQRIGTEEPIQLGALKSNEFWSLFKSFAFGDDNYGQHTNLNSIGQEIAMKLKGNPLAAETAGKILRECLNLEHWSRTLKNEDWKSLQLREGIMPALKHSYDQLPYHLQQCFMYCSIFPNNYKFLAEDLVRTWISLGFVRCASSSKKLKETGFDYLTNLVNLGFLEHVKVISTYYYYSICGIMHDFGRLVSRTEYATVDSLEFNKVLPTIRHLSIVTDSAYLLRDKQGAICRNEKFEKNLQSIFESVEKLRTLVLLGKFDTFFFNSFQDTLHKTQNLRVLLISPTNWETYYSLRATLVSPVHLRHLKLSSKIYNDFHQCLSKWYHIQVLDVAGSGTIPVPIPMDNLVSLVCLVASVTLHSESIPKVTSLQELNCSGSDITKLQFMSKLVQLCLYELGNVTTRHEAYGARLKDKRNLEKLKLSWKDNWWEGDFSLDVYESSEYCASSSSNDSNHSTSSEYYDSSSSNDSNDIMDSEDLLGIASDVLEGLEPHHNLKHLQVVGYCGAESPAWLGSAVSFLQTLHLQDCGEWGELGFLGSLPLLTKLKLVNMQKVQEISIPSLQELVLIEMSKLEKCSCHSPTDLNSSLRVVKILRCSKLKVFPLFGSCEIEQRSWLIHLRELMIHYCPDLVVLHPLPPSDSMRILSIKKVSKLPKISGSSNGSLYLRGAENPLCGLFSDDLTKPSTNILASHNLRVLSRLVIHNVDYPIFSSLEGFRQLINLKCLIIAGCKNLFLSNVPQEDMAPENVTALPSLKTLSAFRMEGMWLSVLLRNVQTLEELSLSACTEITELFIEKDEDESEVSNLKSAWVASSSGDTVAGSSRDKLLRIPSKLISSLKEISFSNCFKESFRGDMKVFSKLTSLEELYVVHCSGLVSSLVHKDKNDEDTNGRLLLPQSLVKLQIDGSVQSEGTLRLCFPGHLTGLKTLIICDNPCLKSLQLQYCTALEELEIGSCESLTALKGLPSLGGLRRLDAAGWPHLIPSLERVSSKGYDMRPRLEILEVDDYSFLTTSFCKHLISLKRLCVKNLFQENVPRLTDEQERALQLLTSLQELLFHFGHLEDLPVGLHKLPSLKRLEILYCQRLSRLPEKGLPPSLKELNIEGCPDVLNDRCRMLATGKLKVKIDGKY
jgi:Leucine-rich repeat (LRR) protein